MGARRMTACFGLSSTLLLLTCLTPTPLCLHGAAGGWRQAVQAVRCRGRTASFSPAPPASPTAAANPQKSSRADNLSLLFPPLVFPSSTALPPCSEPLSPIFPFFFSQSPFHCRPFSIFWRLSSLGSAASSSRYLQPSPILASKTTRSRSQKRAATRSACKVVSRVPCIHPWGHEDLCQRSKRGLRLPAEFLAASKDFF